MKQRDYLEWGEVEFLVDRLIEDKQFLIGLFVLIGCATGMKANDILALHWKDFWLMSYSFVRSQLGDITTQI